MNLVTDKVLANSSGDDVDSQTLELFKFNLIQKLNESDPQPFLIPLDSI